MVGAMVEVKGEEELWLCIWDWGYRGHTKAGVST